MAFRTRRGRPKTKPALPQKDLGTPELRAKRSHQLTSEPLDLCLEKGLISADQHWCGLHLRWLYTLRYGAPSVASSARHLTDPARIRQDDEAWRQSREAEYRHAISELHQWRYYEIVMAVCVFQQTPSFLNQELLRKTKKNPEVAQIMQKHHEQFTAGLQLLEGIWCFAQKM